MTAASLPDWLPFTFERPLVLLLLPLLVAGTLLLARRTRSDLGGSRRTVALAVRLLVVLLAGLAAAGATLRLANPTRSVMFVVDASRSVAPDEVARARRFVEEGIGEMASTDRAGIVLFGAEPALERAPRVRDHERTVTFDTVPDPGGSDIQAALELAQAAFPEGTERQIVLLSDGLETSGSVMDAAQGARAAGIPVSYALTGGTAAGRDLRLDGLLAPPSAREGEAFEVRVVLRGSGLTAPATGKLRLYRDASFLGEEPVEILPDRPSVYRVLQSLDEGGFYRYRAELIPADPTVDAVVENDVGHAFVAVEGVPRILLAYGEPEDAQALRAAFEGADLSVTAVPSFDVPSGLEGLASYQCVVLANVSGLDLSTRQMEALRTYVHDLGGGLLMTGGEESFGPGGYYATPVEEALPVAMDVKNRKYFPTIAMALVIDKSGSMGDLGDKTSKISLAREAAALTCSLLKARDEVMVIAFDSAAQEVVPLHKMTDADAVMTKIGTIRAGGGTDIYPGLHAAYESLRHSKAGAKHVLLLSDGVSAPGDYPGLMAKMKQAGITVSTLAIGEDSDLSTMQQIATLGEGRHYVVNDPFNIPKIFTKETILASRSFLVEEPFQAVQSRTSEVLKGIDVAAAPKLQGYVATSGKARAEVLVETHRGDPLVATWRYGLGKSAAFTSDAKARWAREWLGWEGSGKLWAQLARWCVGTVGSEGMYVVTSIERGDLVVQAEVADAGGTRLNFLDLTARVTAPGGEASEIVLSQTGPGRYRGRTPARAAGSYFVAVTATRDGAPLARRMTGASLSFLDELRRTGQDVALLEGAAELTGGAKLDGPKDVARRSTRRQPVRRPIWSELLATALMLFLVDVGIRRVMLPDAFYDRLLAPIRALRPGRTAPATSHLSRLRQRAADARSRATEEAASRRGAGAATSGAAAAEARRAELEAMEPASSLEQAAGRPSAVPPREAPAAEPDAPPTPAGFSDRLLDAKRRAKKK